MTAPSNNHWITSAQERADFAPLCQNRTADIAIVGAGFTGLSAALNAAQLGMRVSVVEAQTIGHGGSGRNVGLVNAGLWLPPDQIEQTLGQHAGSQLIQRLSRAPDDVFSLIKTHDIDCDAHQNGTLHLAHSPAGLRDLENRQAQWSKRQAPVSILTAEQTAKLTGTSAYYGALLDRRAGVIQPLDYVRGLARAAQSAGAGIYENTPCLSAKYDQGQWHIETPQGEIRAKYVLFATNAYGQFGATPRTPKTSIVHYFQCVSDPLTDEQRAEILPNHHGCWDTALIMSSFRLTRDNRIAFGAMGNPQGLGKPIHRAWFKRAVARIFPKVTWSDTDRMWSGRIAMTAEKIPQIVQRDNAVTVFGYSGRGIAPGTAAGQDIAEFFASDGRKAPYLPITDAYREPGTAVKSMYYELGARAVHTVARS